MRVAQQAAISGQLVPGVFFSDEPGYYKARPHDVCCLMTFVATWRLPHDGVYPYDVCRIHIMTFAAL